MISILICQRRWLMVGLVGLEPTTPRLSSVCSNQLSYRPATAEAIIQQRLTILSFGASAKRTGYSCAVSLQYFRQRWNTPSDGVRDFICR